MKLACASVDFQQVFVPCTLKACKIENQRGKDKAKAFGSMKG
jgi:hypothetical protein